MTPAHVLFIPTVFLLGFLLGRLLTSSAPQQGARAAVKSGVRTLLTAFVAFCGIFAITHFTTLFAGSKAISLAAHGMPLLDQRPSFSSHEVFERLDAFGAVALAMYRRFTYTVDVVFPFSLLILLLLLGRSAARNTSVGAATRKVLTALPVIWFGADMLENTIIFTLIARLPSQEHLLAGVLGFVTVAKFTLLALSITGPAILFIARRKRPAGL